MRYETVKEVLDHARELHEGLAGYYRRLGGEAQGEKVRMLLDYLARHETAMAQSLGRYSRETAANIRDAWFRNAPDEDILACIPPARPVERMTLGEIIDLSIQLDDCIIDLYRRAAQAAELPEAREAFRSLLEGERQEKKRMVRQALGLNDL